MKRVILAVVVLAALAVYAGKLTWDAGETGRLMTTTNDIVLFKGANLSAHRLSGCWFNKAKRVRSDGTPAMCNGSGIVCQAKPDVQALVAQCQMFDGIFTKCVKLHLRQRGDDIVGRVVYAKYCTQRNIDKVGADFDALAPVASVGAYSVLPSGRVTDGYNVDWLELREIGASEDNIPDPAVGAMPQDEVMEWMETPIEATAWAEYRKSHPAPFLLFGEDRHYAVRNDIVPRHWFAKGNHAAEMFRGSAQPGEFYPFQVCVFSEKARRLRWRAETELPVTCITPAECAVHENGVKPIWVMVDIPKDASGKTFRGSVCIKDVQSGESRSLPFEIAVSGKVLADGGISDAWRLARLKWLESDIGRDETVTKPYAPVSADPASRTVRLLGRDLVLGEDGLPAQIVSYFNGSNTRIEKKGFGLLAKPFTFATKGFLPKAGGKFAFTEVKPTHAAWRAETSCGTAKRVVEGRIDYTGTGFFRVRHEGMKSVDASLEISMPSDVARFMEGLGRRGGTFEDGTISYKWDKRHQRDAVWMGRVNGGLAVRFRGANYRRPLVNAYYAWLKLCMPESWASGEGAISVRKSAGGAAVTAGGRGAPENAEWNFELYITPFRALDMKTHIADRYFHRGQHTSSLDANALRKEGATVVNLHHNTLWNPYINYPYNDDGGPLLKKIVSDFHKAGLLVNAYYTTRELTQNMPEFFALKSLDGEVLLKRDESVPGWPITNRSGPHPWLREHVGMDIIPAWHENVNFSAYPNRLDLSVITTPESRWDNFFLEGLDYLVRQYGIDGIYIDDTALTGEAMQRARRILDRDGRRRIVDNHSWSHHSSLAGSGTSNLVFLDLYPYFDRLWRGEGFSNDEPADLWLVERSGIAFGIPSEMLGRGNPFRGLLYGMTDRWGWGGRPQGIWKFFDSVGFGDMELVGWWDDACPVSVSGSGYVKASVWRGRGKSVVVVANYSKQKQRCSLSFDSKKLGFNALKAKWTVPAITDVQKSLQVPDFRSAFDVPGSGGFVFTVEN